MLKEFKQHIKNNFPELLKQPFLLACSAGVDSVVLAHLCSGCGLNFTLAHCNFKLRGAASEADEVFVQGLGRKLKAECLVTSFDTDSYINKNKVSLQMAARELRYSWFAELLRENHYDFVVTAHHADDNLETFIINLSRGTGLDGLSGIPKRTTSVLRPLLAYGSEDILKYARENKIAWREDATNADTKYLRNKIRHEIVPKLKELHPTFDKNFAKTLEYLEGTSSLVERHISDVKKALFEPYNNHFRISVASLSTLNPLKAYLHALFREYGFTAWDDVSGLLTTSSGKEVRSATHRLIKDRDALLLQKIPDVREEKEILFLDDPNTELAVRLLQTSVDKITETAETILYVDKETLNDKLYVRKWRNGDYFYPLGMKGRKKISKFFKDEKMDLISKESQWLLCSAEEIVWVIGRRADDRFKVSGETKKILKFRWVE